MYLAAHKIPLVVTFNDTTDLEVDLEHTYRTWLSATKSRDYQNVCGDFLANASQPKFSDLILPINVAETPRGIHLYYFDSYADEAHAFLTTTTTYHDVQAILLEQRDKRFKRVLTRVNGNLAA